MNNFYASVECMLDMSLRGRPVAVGGDEENRHGIILAKNYEAKKYGVKTGEALWQARQKCRDLLIVPPHYEEYLKYSRLAHEIYADYTDRIEPYGMDEVWMDVTGTQKIKGDGEKIANEIRERVKFELGLTVSLGVSFNKIFAKLGSDMKKPDAVTVISRENFKEKIWGLDVAELLGVGKSTERTLKNYRVYTIGDLANFSEERLRSKMGKFGPMLIAFANGEDYSQVARADLEVPVKSVGHGITPRDDLENSAEVFNLMLALSQDIGHKLRLYGKRAYGVQIAVRDTDLFTKLWQCKLKPSTNSAAVIAKSAFELFQKSYRWDKKIRSITVRAIDLNSEIIPEQLDFFCDNSTVEKHERVDEVVDAIRGRFGKYSIMPAVLYQDIKMPTDREVELRMPTGLLYM